MKTALLFAGQGAQVLGMGRDLALYSPIAQELFDRANHVLGYDLASICSSGPEADLTQTENAQPGIFLVSWIACQLLLERCPNLEFHAAAGLSLGEFTALTFAGAFAFDDALKLVRSRGQFMREACDLTRGGMAAIIGLDETATRDVCLQTRVEIANLNCPGQIVISGETTALKAACDLAKTRGAKRALPLPVAGAYHSQLMASAQPKLRESLASIRMQPLHLPVISNVTAQPHGAPVQIADLLVQQVTAPVRWEASMRYLLAQGFTRFIELGPGAALSGFMRRIDSSVQIFNVADLATFRETSRQLRTEKVDQ